MAAVRNGIINTACNKMPSYISILSLYCNVLTALKTHYKHLSLIILYSQTYQFFLWARNTHAFIDPMFSIDKVALKYSEADCILFSMFKFILIQKRLGVNDPCLIVTSVPWLLQIIKSVPWYATKYSSFLRIWASSLTQVTHHKLNPPQWGLQ